MKRRVSIAAVIAAAVMVIPGSATPKRVGADEAKTLRIATLAPRGSSWMKVFKAWNNTLKKKTDGKLKLRFYPGGVAGEERDFIRKMRSGQMDGAAVTSTGLGQIVRPVLVLQLPGLFDSYSKIDKVRKKLDDEFEQQFESNGYKLLGWGDVGKGRIFANRPVRKPSDLKKTRPWAPKEDPIFSTFLKSVGANPVRLGVNEVYPQLQTGMINAVPSSSIAAVSLQWFTRVSHVTKQSNSILIGATLLKKDEFEALPSSQQKALMKTSKRAHAALSRAIRRDDRRAYKTILNRGVEEVDLSAHQSKWDRAAKKVEKKLAGRLFPRSLLKRVKQAK